MYHVGELLALLNDRYEISNPQLAEPDVLAALRDKANFKNFKAKPFSMAEFYNRTGHDLADMLLQCSFRGANCTARNFTVVSAGGPSPVLGHGAVTVLGVAGGRGCPHGAVSVLVGTWGSPFLSTTSPSHLVPTAGVPGSWARCPCCSPAASPPVPPAPTAAVPRGALQALHGMRGLSPRLLQ